MRVENTTPEKTVKLKFPMRDMVSDRISFKPYGIVLGMDDVFVEVDVPEKYIVSQHNPMNQQTVLTLEGIVWLSDKIASEIEKVHTKWLQSHQR